MVYGLIDTSKEDREARTLYRSKKIPDGNLVSMTDSVRLSSSLKSGDVVRCFSVEQFVSVGLLYEFCIRVNQRSAVVHFFEQPYLDFGNGKQWKNAVEKEICGRIQAEQDYVSLLFSKIRLNDQCRWFVSRCISNMNIHMLAKTYSADGILRRGS